jgi:hypothetical protein
MPDLGVQTVAIVASAVLLLGVLELVRRRRLMERYALLWILSATVLLVLSVWRELLEDIAHKVGVFYAPSAMFMIAIGFILLLLLHFSVAVSKLSDQSKVLAQRLALLEQRVREAAAVSELATEEDEEEVEHVAR